MPVSRQTLPPVSIIPTTLAGPVANSPSIAPWERLSAVKTTPIEILYVESANSYEQPRTATDSSPERVSISHLPVELSRLFRSAPLAPKWREHRKGAKIYAFTPKRSRDWVWAQLSGTCLAQATRHGRCRPFRGPGPGRYRRQGARADRRVYDRRHADRRSKVGFAPPQAMIAAARFLSPETS